MSVFKNDVAKFKSDITGEEIGYEVNNYFWVYMKEEFDMNPETFDEGIKWETQMTIAKLVVSVMKANDMEVTLEEVLRRTTSYELLEFYEGFFDIYHGKNPIEQAVEIAAKARQERLEAKH